MNQIDVQHQENEEIFYIVFEDGQKAFLRYRYTEPRSDGVGVDFYSTFVPDDQRGKGVAEKLVEHGFSWANKNEFSIQASCWYAAKIMAAKDAAEPVD
jgi:predicted GNAT family acetyltransferase